MHIWALSSVYGNRFLLKYNFTSPIQTQTYQSFSSKMKDTVLTGYIIQGTSEGKTGGGGGGGEVSIEGVARVKSKVIFSTVNGINEILPGQYYHVRISGEANKN